MAQAILGNQRPSGAPPDINSSMVKLSTTSEQFLFGTTLSTKTADDAFSTITQDNTTNFNLLAGGVLGMTIAWSGDGVTGASASTPRVISLVGYPISVVITRDGAGIGSGNYSALYRPITSLLSYTGTAVGTAAWDDTNVSFYATTALNGMTTAGVAYTATIMYLPTLFSGQATVTVKSPKGNPLKNAQLLGLSTSTGGQVFTDNNGVATGYGINGRVCTIINPKYLDIKDTSFMLSGLASTSTKSYPVTMGGYPNNTIFEISTSQTVYFVDNHVVQVAIVNGGTSGSRSSVSAYSSGASGGPGGAVGTSPNNVTVTAETAYPAVVGAGGSEYSSTPESGGASSFLTYTTSNTSGTGNNYAFNDSAFLPVHGGSGGSGGSGNTSSPGSIGSRAGGTGGNGASPGSSSAGAGSPGTRGGGGGGSGGYNNVVPQAGNALNFGGKGGTGTIFTKIIS